MRRLGLVLVVVASLAVGGCAQDDESATPVERSESTFVTEPEVDDAVPSPTSTTEAPTPTEAPVPTEAPTSTEAPVLIEVPTSTEAPVLIEVPTSTEAPVLIEVPKPTEAPTPTPAETEVAGEPDELEPPTEDPLREETEPVNADGQEPLDQAVAQDEYTPCRPSGRAGFLTRPEFLPSIGTLRLAVLFVDFEESQADYSTQEEAEQSLPYVEEYLDAASYGKLNIEFVPLHKWLRAEHSRDYYNLDGLKRYGPDGWEKVGVTIQSEAVRLASPEFDFSGIDALFVVMPSKHYGGGNSGAGGTTTPAGELYWAPSVNSMNVSGGPEGPRPWGYVATHELTHALGLLDLYPHIVNRPYPPSDRNWTKSSFGLMGLDATHPVDGSNTWHAYAFEMLAWSRWQLGWLEEEQVLCVSEEEVVTALSPIAEPGDGLAMAVVPLSESEVLVVESRRKVGFDLDPYGYLRTEGVLVYTVDAALGSGELPILIGEDAERGYIEHSPVLVAGESINVRGYTITVQSSTPQADTVQISKTGS